MSRGELERGDDSGRLPDVAPDDDTGKLPVKLAVGKGVGRGDRERDGERELVLDMGGGPARTLRDNRRLTSAPLAFPTIGLPAPEEVPWCATCFVGVW